MKKTITPPFVRSPYNYDTNQASDDAGLDTGREGGAKQSFKDEVDINTIVKRFGIGHELPPNPKVPEYGDYTNIPDFHTAMNLVATTRENFEELPAAIRAKFDNDPTAYVDFCLNPDNREELKQMGLLSKEAIERDQAAAAALARTSEALPGSPTSRSPDAQQDHKQPGEDNDPSPRPPEKVKKTNK